MQDAKDLFGVGHVWDLYFVQLFNLLFCKRKERLKMFNLKFCMNKLFTNQCLVFFELVIFFFTTAEVAFVTFS